MEGMQERAPPLSQDQRVKLLRLVGEYKVLQDRSTNPALIGKKAHAWEEVRKAFTAINPDSHRRTVDQLRRCYSRIKMSVKKEESMFKKLLKQTGGGKPPTPPSFSEEHDLLSEMMPGEIKMGQGAFDTFFVVSPNQPLEDDDDLHPSLDDPLVLSTQILDMPDSFAPLPSTSSSSVGTFFSGTPNYDVPAKVAPIPHPSTSAMSSVTPNNPDAPLPSTSNPAFIAAIPHPSTSAAATYTKHKIPRKTPPSATPTSSGNKPKRGRFAMEYDSYRRKQDEYYELLIEQTKIEHKEQMRVYEKEIEVADLKKKLCVDVSRREDTGIAVSSTLTANCVPALRSNITGYFSPLMVSEGLPLVVLPPTVMTLGTGLSDFDSDDSFDDSCDDHDYVQ
ncbi:hypothetical protein GWK47_012074 [Chionoecetes opilio]|uniref:Regulatory protein zeste n=1 Tax=Chionoecetes opilio TaxID=41210 RepID=A0A8J4XX15_CHIOP|nr:hypothetical protein GWK47_012074 [Chionoecetes opilio]